MGNILIPIISNGKTTLLTGGKYCPENIELDVSVGGGSTDQNSGFYAGLIYNERTGEYRANCTRCGETAVWNHLCGKLPDAVAADLEKVGYDLDFVYDCGADDLHTYGKWDKQDDASSSLGRAVVLDTALAPNTVPKDDKTVYIGDGASNVPLCYHSRTKLLENNNRGYQIYKWENVVLGGVKGAWLNLWDNAKFDGPTWSFPAELIGNPIDLYLSIKTSGWENSQFPVFSIDRVIAVAYCGNERSIGTDIMDGSIVAIEDKVAKSLRSYALYGCGELGRLSLPNVEKIGTYALCSCTNLSEVYLPKVKTDSGASFEKCTSLKHIELPALEVLSAWSFNNCTNLASIGIGTATQTVCNLLHDTAFSGTPVKSGTGFIYVPANMVDSYKASEKWKTYVNQIRPASARIGSTYYATLGEAFDSVQDGETIYIMAGTYEALTLTNTERVFKDITVKPVEGAAVTIKGVYSNSGFENAVFENITFDGGTVTHGFKVERYFDGLTFKNCGFRSNLYVLCAYAGTADNPYGCSFSNLVIDGCSFSMGVDLATSNVTAIMLRPINGLTVKNSTFTNIGYNGIQITPTNDTSIGDITIQNNTFVDIGSRNLNLSGVDDNYTANLIIEGNTFDVPVWDVSIEDGGGNFVRTKATEKVWTIGVNYPIVDNTGDYYYKGVVPAEG